VTQRSTFGVLSVLASLVLGSAVLAAAPANQPAYHPQVTMSITPPSASAKTLTIAESGTATLTANGVEYGFRPTMLDDQGTRDIITVFTMPTATKGAAEIGEVEVKLGAPAVSTKTTPSFKVAVTKVDKPAM
jgi:hypothetical protein